MDLHTLRILEFDKVLGIISKQAVSPYGINFILARRPFNDLDRIVLTQNRVSEAKQLLEKGVLPPFDPLAEIGTMTLEAQKGVALNPQALWQIGLFLKTTRLVKDFLKENGKNSPRLCLLEQ